MVSNGTAQDRSAIDAFAQQLGIHPSEEAQFGWLAEVGLQSPLPPRWTSHTDETTGFIYYVDHDRQASSWENPLVPYLRRVVEIGRAYLENRTWEFFEEQKGLLWHQHKQDLDCWHGPFADDQGRSYYVNSTAGISSWQDPRVDAQYVFELESGLLTSLQEVLPDPDAEEPDTPGWGEENQPWRTATGAEVLTLEAQANAGAAKGRDLQKKLTMSMANWKLEHQSTMEKMSSTAQWLRTAQQDEQEVQRLQISKKVAERQRRKQHARTRVPCGSPKGNAAVESKAASGAAQKLASSAAFTLSEQPLSPMPMLGDAEARPATAPAPPSEAMGLGAMSPPPSMPPSPACHTGKDKRAAFLDAALGSTGTPPMSREPSKEPSIAPMPCEMPSIEPLPSERSEPEPASAELAASALTTAAPAPASSLAALAARWSTPSALSAPAPSEPLSAEPGEPAPASTVQAQMPLHSSEPPSAELTAPAPASSLSALASRWSNPDALSASEPASAELGAPAPASSLSALASRWSNPDALSAPALSAPAGPAAPRRLPPLGEPPPLRASLD